VALAVGALLAVSSAHVRYSGRVKSYVFETAAVLALAVIVPWLAARRWSWSLAGAWLVLALALGTVSAFCLVAAGAAGFVLALHRNEDLARRWTAIGLQAVVQVGYLAVVQRRFDSSAVADDWERVYNGYIELHPNLFRVLGELASHAGQVGRALVGGPLWLGFVVFVASVVGLGIAAARGPDRVVARFLLLLPAIALVGSFIRQVPFGAVDNGVSPGSRSALWLLPGLVVGLALLVDRAARRAARRSAGSATVVNALGVVAAVALVATGIGDAPKYPLEGARRAAAYVRDHRDADTRVVVLKTGLYPLAAEPGLRVRIDADPDKEVGFTPVFRDRRITVYSDQPAVPPADQLRRFVEGARVVLVHDGLVGVFDPIRRVEAGLRRLGFRRAATHVYGKAAVFVWRREGR
jgi:hypothetical protein